MKFVSGCFTHNTMFFSSSYFSFIHLLDECHHLFVQPSEIASIAKRWKKKVHGKPPSLTNRQPNKDEMPRFTENHDKTLEVNKIAISRSFVIIPLDRQWILKWMNQNVSIDPCKNGQRDHRNTGYYSTKKYNFNAASMPLSTLNGGRFDFIIQHIIQERETCTDYFWIQINSKVKQTHTKTIGTTEIGLRFKTVPAIKFVAQLYRIFISLSQAHTYTTQHTTAHMQKRMQIRKRPNIFCCRLVEHDSNCEVNMSHQFVLYFTMFAVSFFLFILFLLHLAFTSRWMQLILNSFSFFHQFYFLSFVRVLFIGRMKSKRCVISRFASDGCFLCVCVYAAFLRFSVSLGLD